MTSRPIINVEPGQVWRPASDRRASPRRILDVYRPTDGGHRLIEWVYEGEPEENASAMTYPSFQTWALNTEATAGPGSVVQREPKAPAISSREWCRFEGRIEAYQIAADMAQMAGHSDLAARIRAAADQVRQDLMKGPPRG